MDKNAALQEAHESIAKAFNLEVGDVAIGFPVAKFDDAIRIAEGLKKIDRQADNLKQRGHGAMAAGILGSMFIFPASSIGGATYAASLAVEAVTFGVSAIFHVTSKTSYFLRKDRENEVKAAIEYGKTPEWIHRLARENKL